MNNDLIALNNYLFATLERLDNDELSAEEMQAELARADAVTSVAETIIHTGELALKALKHSEEYNIGNRADNDKRQMPPMLSAGMG